MNNLQPWRTGLALAVTVSVLYLVCASLYALWPDAVLDYFNAWFHGLDFRLLLPPGGKPLSVGSVFYGLVGLGLTAFVVGALFAFVHGRLGFVEVTKQKKRKREQRS